MNKCTMICATAIVISLVSCGIIQMYSFEENALDVLVIDGQSNAAYWNSFSNVEVNEEYVSSAPQHNLYYYGSEYHPIVYEECYSVTDYGLYPMYDENNKWRIGGYEPILASIISEKLNHDLLIINVAVGAKSIAWLCPTGGGGDYAKTIIDDALSKIKGYDSINMIGWIWAQGENDFNMAISAYKQGFHILNDYFDQLGFTNCYIINTRIEYGGNATIAQKQIADNDENITIVTDISYSFTEENGLLQATQPIHYSQKGRIIIAEIMGEYIAQDYGTQHLSKNYSTVTIINIIEFILILSSGVTFMCLLYGYKKNEVAK